jgi:imidazoleglycerol-phosphate dehydratase
MRNATIERTTKETSIELGLNLDGGKIDISTGHGFYDHMLEAFAKHGRMGLEVEAKGDNTGPHHLAEDVAIVIGEALLKSAGDKAGIERFGHASIPMDDTLVDISVDFGGRGFLVFDCPEVQDVETGLGVHLVHDIFYAMCFNGRFNLHLRLIHGRNPHHIYEAMFKGTGVALRRALAITGTDIPSTKGVL